jgi:hypothetical protein
MSEVEYVMIEGTPAEPWSAVYRDRELWAHIWPDPSRYGTAFHGLVHFTPGYDDGNLFASVHIRTGRALPSVISTLAQLERTPF